MIVSQQLANNCLRPLDPYLGKGSRGWHCVYSYSFKCVFWFKIGKGGVDINHHFLHFFDIVMTGTGKPSHCKYVINFTIVRV